jgi:hypothetical protein
VAEAVLLKTLRLWNGSHAMHPTMNRVSLTMKREELANGVFGDVHEAFEQGLQQNDLTFGGRWGADAAATATEPDNLLAGRLADSLAWPITVAPPNAPAATAGATGNLAYIMVGKQYSFTTVGGQHGELAAYDCASRASSGGGGLYRGTILLPDTSVVATTTGTAVQLGVVSAAQKYVVALHVVAINGGSWVLTIESDNASNFATPTTRATFTAATTRTQQVIETNGAITDDWWRAVLTKTGGTSCTAVVAMAVAAQ